MLGNLVETQYECHNSSGWYTEIQFYKITYNIVHYTFIHKCENDDQSYQACGYQPKTFQSYENAICQFRVFNSRKAEMVTKPLESDETVVLPTGSITYQEYICNEKCDLIDTCEDEANCNGFIYGEYCQERGSRKITYIKPEDICTELHNASCSEDERWVSNQRRESDYLGSAILACHPNNTKNSNRCQKIFRYKHDLIWPIYDDRVAILNSTRCTPTK